MWVGVGGLVVYSRIMQEIYLTYRDLQHYGLMNKLHRRTDLSAGAQPNRVLVPVGMVC